MCAWQNSSKPEFFYMVVMIWENASEKS